MEKVYKNVDEFIRVTFPKYYEERERYINDFDEFYTRKSLRDFKSKIDNRSCSEPSVLEQQS
jgi:hypothetical protein